MHLVLQITEVLVGMSTLQLAMMEDRKGITNRSFTELMTLTWWKQTGDRLVPLPPLCLVCVILVCHIPPTWSYMRSKHQISFFKPTDWILTWHCTRWWTQAKAIQAGMGWVRLRDLCAVWWLKLPNRIHSTIYSVSSLWKEAADIESSFYCQCKWNSTSEKNQFHINPKWAMAKTKIKDGWIKFS